MGSWLNWQTVQNALPYALLVIGGLIVLYVVFKYAQNRVKPERDWNKEAYDQKLAELKKRKISRGVSSSFVTLFFLVFGGAVGYALGSLLDMGTYFTAAVVIIALMFYIGGCLVVSTFRDFFERCNYVYTKSMNRFGLVESVRMYDESDFVYLLVQRGTKWLFWANHEIVIFPTKAKYEYITQDKKGGKPTKHILEFNQDIVNNLYFMNERGDYITNAVDFEKHGYYYFPVVRRTQKKEFDLFSFRDIAFIVNKRETDELTMSALLNDQHNNMLTAVGTNPWGELGRKAGGTVKTPDEGDED